MSSDPNADKDQSGAADAVASSSNLFADIDSMLFGKMQDATKPREMYFLLIVSH